MLLARAPTLTTTDLQRDPSPQLSTAPRSIPSDQTEWEQKYGSSSFLLTLDPKSG